MNTARWVQAVVLVGAMAILGIGGGCEVEPTTWGAIKGAFN